MISDEFEKTLQRTQGYAKKFGHFYMTLEHLLLSLLDDQDVKTILSACSIDAKTLRTDLEDFIKKNLKELEKTNDDEIKPTLGFQRVIQRAVIHVQSSGNEEANGANVLVALFSERESHAVYFLQQQNLTRLDVVDYISHGIAKDENAGTQQDEKVDENTESPTDSMNSFLEKYCVNLNRQVVQKKIDPIIGRAKEIERTIHILSRRNKNNPIFVGDPGVGKTALAEGLAFKIVNGEVPDSILNTTIYSLDLGGMLAGTKFRGDFEDRLKKLINFFEKNSNFILFIDEIHTLIGAGGTTSGSMDASNILKPALSKGNLRCMGSTTYSEYRNYFEKDRALCRRFQKIDIDEPSTENSIKILSGIKEFYESYHNVQFEIDCFEEAVNLSKKYLVNQKLPDKAIDILDEAAASVKINSKRKNKLVSKQDIQNTISKIANIPENTIKSNDKVKLKNLERDLKTLIFGQDEAINVLSSAIKLSKIGLRNKDKPIGSFLFAGPTGVGKTELTKQLANIMKMNFVRFDMSEYMERHSVSKLIGAPPGYVGFDQGGLLTDSIDKTPHSVILLDEIEKAHPDLFNLLLQIMDYGKLTDHLGKKVDFTNSIIVMTSNVGAVDIVRDKIGFMNDKSIQDNEKAIKSFFSPEFRNRLDAVVNFKMLNKNHSLKIVDKFLMELENLLYEKELSLSVTKEAKLVLLEKGFDPTNGARPMAKVIQDQIKVPLANLLLKSPKKMRQVLIDFSTKKDEFLISLKDDFQKADSIYH
ncbi:MAG: ATP-dependent Clp protease ATP-binding subunit ClpA [Alphaproteobacteria bacterium]